MGVDDLDFTIIISVVEGDTRNNAHLQYWKYTRKYQRQQEVSHFGIACGDSYPANMHFWNNIRIHLFYIHTYIYIEPV